MTARAQTPAGFNTHPDYIDEPRGSGVRNLWAPPDPDEPRETCVVACGRTIDQPDEDAEKVVAGYDNAKGKYTYRHPCRRFYPGEQISLPISEARRLRELLTDPNGEQPVGAPS